MKKKKGFGFIYEDALPAGECTTVKLNVDGIDLETTAETADIADNHCACVCAVNVLKLVQNNRKTVIAEQGIENENRHCFELAHRYIVNGPIFRFRSRLKRFFGAIGCILVCKRAGGLAGIKSELEGGRPVALMVHGDGLDFHWILAIGYKDYGNGTVYLNLVDNWNKRHDRYLKVKPHFTWFRAVKFIDRK